MTGYQNSLSKICHAHNQWHTYHLSCVGMATAHSKQKCKPDLRYDGFLPKGVYGVRIEFVIDKDLVLLSDFDAWHSVLNDWCYARTKKEFDDYDILQKTLPKADFDKIKEQSWRGIFDISRTPDNYAIQAVFWQ